MCVLSVQVYSECISGPGSHSGTEPRTSSTLSHARHGYHAQAGTVTAQQTRPKASKPGDHSAPHCYHPPSLTNMSPIISLTLSSQGKQGSLALHSPDNIFVLTGHQSGNIGKKSEGDGSDASLCPKVCPKIRPTSDLTVFMYNETRQQCKVA